jgi:putative membrane protein
MNSMLLWTLVFHVIGLVFWIGGLLVVVSLFRQLPEEALPEAQVALSQAGTKMLNAMATPGAIITIITGIILIEVVGPPVLQQAWLHAKLSLVLGLLVLHGIVYLRARRVSAGLVQLHRRGWMILHAAISLVFFGILICVIPGRLYWK